MSSDVQARQVEPETFEVTLNLSAKAEREGDALFIVELAYAGLFQIRGVDERAREPFLLIECPRLLFPFARRVLSDATRDGGFPPLMLEPVDFAALYRQQLARQGGGEGETGGQPPAGNA
jgi:preprotein translocase subunit SecB